MKDYSYTPVIVTGVPRSRTSLVAGILHRNGLWMGEICGAVKANPRGMFENTALRNYSLKPFLCKLGYDPMGQSPLPNYTIPPLLGVDYLDFVKKHKKVLSIQAEFYKFDWDAPWGWKEPKTCLLWECYYDMYPAAKWVIVRRKKEAVVDSVLRTSFMKAFSNKERWSEWHDAYVAKLKQMKDVVDYKEIWTDPLVEKSFDRIREITEWVGLKWDVAKTASFVDPGITRI
jgi:hypothetical protein